MHSLASYSTYSVFPANPDCTNVIFSTNRGKKIGTNRTKALCGTIALDLSGNCRGLEKKHCIPDLSFFL